MLLRIWVFNPKVVYISGKQIQITEGISWLIKQGKDEEIEGLSLVFHTILASMSAKRQSTIAWEMAWDETLI